MSEHMMVNINNVINNTNNQDRQDPSGGGVKHVAQRLLNLSNHKFLLPPQVVQCPAPNT